MTLAESSTSLNLVGEITTVRTASLERAFLPFLIVAADRRGQKKCQALSRYPASLPSQHLGFQRIGAVFSGDFDTSARREVFFYSLSWRNHQAQSNTLIYKFTVIIATFSLNVLS
ncbi:MAG: hypothetical protein ACRENG_34145, partial [bacterium]